VKAARAEQARLEAQHSQLKADVARLQAIKQQHQEFRTRLEALELQLARSRAFVPAEKQTDEFIRTLQGSAAGAQVAVRRLRSRAVVIKEFYAEMPFDVQMDGAYYDVSGFFDRLGKTGRIINASALSLQGVSGRGGGGGGSYAYAAGTTVSGECVVTTYYTPSEAEMAAAAPPARGGRAAGGRGAAARGAARGAAGGR
jgi:Tfp pilus assembly protein PilO